MKPEGILIIASALPVSIATSYLSRRFWPGFLLPLACLTLYLVLLAFHSAGGRLDQVAHPLAWSLVALIVAGLPMSALSGIGAWLGLYLAKRRFAIKEAPGTGEIENR